MAASMLLETTSVCPEPQCFDGLTPALHEPDTGAWIPGECGRCLGTGEYVSAVRDPETGEWLVLT